jgi:hypothetical protein
MRKSGAKDTAATGGISAGISSENSRKRRKTRIVPRQGESIPVSILKYKYNPGLNKEWHLAHPMPVRPTMEQRIKWHMEHVNHCDCRPIPEKLAEEMKKRGMTS